jgi:hypothetical protein
MEKVRDEKTWISMNLSQASFSHQLDIPDNITAKTELSHNKRNRKYTPSGGIQKFLFPFATK